MSDKKVLELNNEAKVVFQAAYPYGEAITGSSEIYFTSSTKVSAISTESKTGF